MTDLRAAAQQALEAKQVPLRELLASVPADARLVIHDADGKGTRSIPVGRLCHEAAAALAEPQESVKLPTTATEAELMAKAGLMWLEQNAPDRLLKPVQDERTTIADLRCAKWLDPECADKGACQSLKFKRSAEPVQEQAKPDHETRAEIAEQQVVQLAEERDHYRHLWQKAQQAEPVPEPDSPERRCGGRGCDGTCCQPVQEPVHGIGGEV